MSAPEIEAERTHPIRVVARRTGLSPDVLRSWEKRYGAVRPRRRGNRRFYSSEDLERLLLLRRATLQGRSIGQVARLRTKQIRDMVAADESATREKRGTPSLGGIPDGNSPEPGRGLPTLAPADHLERCLRAATALDATALDAALAQATVDLSSVSLVEQVVLPLLCRVGEMWTEGSLCVAHEHAASAVIRTFLGGMESAGRGNGSPAQIVSATPRGQRHELGALVASITASFEGWGTTYLGPDLPAEEIATAVRIRGAKVVALSLVYPADDPRVDSELRRLRRLLGETTTIVLGGASSGGYQETADAIGAIQVRDLAGFRAVLREMRGAGL
jgi:DNA-binding transcriptional MerR regulator